MQVGRYFPLLILSKPIIIQQEPSGRDPRLRGKVILRVKQTMIIYKHNTQKKSY